MVKRDAISEEKLMEIALEVGASDVIGEGELWEVVCEPAEFHFVREKVENSVMVESAEVTMIANNRISLAADDAEKMIRLLETLEELDDVLNVVSNCDFPEEMA